MSLPRHEISMGANFTFSSIADNSLEALSRRASCTLLNLVESAASSGSSRLHFSMNSGSRINKLCGRPPQYAPPLHLLTLKVVPESRVTWATSVPILVLLGFSILDLGPMYATDVRQTDVRRASSLNSPYRKSGA